MSKAENTSENEEKIENQNEQNNSINIEENDSVKSENLSSIQEETENSQNEENVQSENLEEGKNQNTQNYNFANSQKTLISEAAEKVKQNQKSKEKNALENPQKSEKVETELIPQEEKITKNFPEQKQIEFEKRFESKPVCTEKTNISPIYRILNVDPFEANRSELNCLYPESVIIRKDEFGKTKEFIINGLKNLVVTTENNSRLIKKVYDFPKNVDKELFFAYYAGLPIYYDEDNRKIVSRLLYNSGLRKSSEENAEWNKANFGKAFDIYGNTVKEINPPFNNFFWKSAKRKAYEKDKNLFSKWGSHITDDDDNMFELDNGKGKVISVEYLNQLSAKIKDEYLDTVDKVYKNISGKDMCQLTALAMLLNYLGLPEKYTPDKLYRISENMGVGKNKIFSNILADNFRKIMPEISSKLKVRGLQASNRNYEDYKKQIKKQIDKDIPVPISLYYKINSKNKEVDTGHVVLVVGYTENGFIIHDPYGNLNKGKNSHLSDDFDGSYVEYPYDKYNFNSKYAVFVENK